MYWTGALGVNPHIQKEHAHFTKKSLKPIILGIQEHLVAIVVNEFTVFWFVNASVIDCIFKVA